MAEASAAEKDLYSHGFCHVHAIAAHRLHGGSFLLILDYEEPYWCDETDPDNDQPSVVHVFSLHDTGQGVIARDVHGDRPVDEALQDARERFHAYRDRVVTSRDTLEELLGYVDQDEDDDRPLCTFTEDDIAEAQRVATVAAPLPGTAPVLEPERELEDAPAF